MLAISGDRHDDVCDVLATTAHRQEACLEEPDASIALIDVSGAVERLTARGLESPTTTLSITLIETLREARRVR